jgi:hypothetical protein
VPAISVGSVEVDVLPNATGVRARLQGQLLPAANSVGDEVGRVIGRYITSHVASAFVQGIQTGGRQAQVAAGRQGHATGSTFARMFKARLEAALATLPEVRLRADSSDAEREIYQIRAQMRALADARIGIDVSTATANAAIARLQERLSRLSASDADVAVRVDAGAASAQLAAFQSEVNRLDGQSVDIDVDTRSAAANFHLLTSAALAFGPAILPVLPVVAAGLGAVAAAGVAAAAGLGGIALVAVPAFKQIGGVLQAQKAAQEAATNATLRGGQAAAQAASRSLQQASAQQALATAERSGARQIAQAQQQVKQARQQAADAVSQAARRVQDAERSLADAQKSARQAQLDLTAARRAAVQELEDLNNRLADSVLSQRDAQIALTEATAERDRVLNSETATELDKQKALLAYDQAVQRLKEQTTETGRLKKETAAANKAGVDGSKTVTDAQDKLAQAQRKVADQQVAVRDAQVQGARQIADAQQRVSEATANVAVAQQSAADAVASAQRQIQSASASAAGGVDQAAIAQAKYQAELAKLTPAARQTMAAYTGLRDAFSAWSKSLQPAVMPIFTRALRGMTGILPKLTPVVLGAAGAVQTLMDKAGQQLKTPFWKGFYGDLVKSVKPAIIGLGVAFGNVFKGMAGIIGAFLPHMDGISESMQRITGRFADWAAGLRGSPEFEKFLSYSARMAPVVWQALKDIAGAALSVAKAMAPISLIALKAISTLANGIDLVATKAPWLVQGIYAIVLAVTAWKVAVAAWAVAQRVATAAMFAFNLVSKAGPWGWIVLAITAVVLAVVVMYKKFDWFRAAVQAVWSGLKTGAQAVVDWFKGPFVDFFVKTLPAAFQASLTWVKQNWPWLVGALGGPMGLAVVAILKHWGSIKQGFSDAWDWIKRWVVSPIGTFFTKTIPGWGTTLAEKTVAAFNSAKDGIKTAWDQIKAITKAPVQYVVDVVYNTGIRGVWNKIAGAFGAPKLPEFKFASGGIMPGYTPGRDVHRFVSPTGGALELSGGESIMRPEFTRAVGAGFVNTMNSIARSRGSEGIKAALAPAFGGNPQTPTDTSLRYATGGIVQSFADGGIFGWIKSAGSAVMGAGSAAWNKIKEGASWLKDTLEASARAGVKNIVDPLLKSFPGMNTGIGQLIRHIPDKIIDALFGYGKEADKQGGGGLGGPRIQAALKWAKTQNGLPYQWAGNGNPSWDCSGFMSAIESVIRGQKPHRRWATMAFSGKTAPPGWVYHGDSPFRVGITNAGVGHTAGTLGGTNVESRGGDGVVVGSRARGYKDGLFGSWYGFKPGSYDSGGYLQPGLNLAYNGTGRPEPVFTRQQASALMSGAAQGTAQPVVVELHPKAGALGDFIDVRIQNHDQKLISVFDAS